MTSTLLTPSANSLNLVRATNRSIDAFGWTPTLEETIKAMRSFGSTLGILELNPDDYLKKEKLSRKPLEIDEEEINDLIEERNAARKEKTGSAQMRLEHISIPKE